MNDAVQFFQEEYRRVRGTGPDWLLPGRDAAMEAFRAAGFPTPRLEEWKYTDTRPIAKAAFRSAEEAAAIPAGDLDTWRFPGLDAVELVFVNGAAQPGGAGASREAGVTVRTLARALTEPPPFLRAHLARHADVRRSPFVALNTAFINDGAVVHVAKGTDARVPIHLLFASTAPRGSVAAHPRNLILVEENARAVVIENYAGAAEDEYLTDATTEIVLEPGACLEYYRVQQEGARSFHVGHTVVRQERGSRLVSHALALGGKLARTDLDVILAGPGAEAVLNGLYVGGGRQHIDSHTRIEHVEPHCRSDENYRGVLNGRARAVFNGKVVVHPGAQQTDARQANANLLLSDEAEVDTKPELEIYADDVKCSHGATVGRLDADMLFYLRSRAIPEAVARSLLTFAFAGDVIGRLDLAPVRARVQRAVAGRLPDPEIINEFLQ
jgi:Fe-S cluster assembly protein SufD